MPIKCAYNPLFANKSAKVADKIILHGQKRIIFETQYFRWGISHPPLPTVAKALYEHTNLEQKIKAKH